MSTEEMFFVALLIYIVLGAILAPVSVSIERFYRSRYMRISLDSIDALILGLLAFIGFWAIMIPYNIYLIWKNERNAQSADIGAENKEN